KCYKAFSAAVIIADFWIYVQSIIGATAKIGLFCVIDVPLFVVLWGRNAAAHHRRGGIIHKARI
ncbi:hypothetical protein, partial [Rhizobium sp. WYCCWR 11152]|uniref:hypothetical protein n=1 Tax=Rhizobium sp. WYCCWR 11152 TaxID=2692316 RepID=UPI001AEDE2FD